MSVPEPLDRDEYANKFRSSHQLIVLATESRVRYLEQLMHCIEDCQEAVRYAKEQHPNICFQDPNELEQTKKLLEGQLALSLIVFGRSNTGKSTLLNQMLRRWPDQSDGRAGALFPMAEQNCSARIAVVCYGPTKEASVIDPRPSDGSAPVVLERKSFQTAGDIRNFMDLMGSQREDEEELRKCVEIQVAHPLLRNRLRLVDSPGMGEKEAMNRVVRAFLANLKSGIIIYVIDGKEGYKPNPDSDNIKFLMEQHVSLQKLLVANRVDFDFDVWYNDFFPDPDWDIEDDPIEDILEDLKNTENFNYTQKCRDFTAERLESVRKQVELLHPDCLSGGPQSAAALMGVSARSVKNFIANEQRLAHPPYVDSFLELESRIAALVYENGRRHLLTSAQTARRQLVQAKTLSVDFFYDRSEKSDQMMQLLERSIETIREIFGHICMSLNSVLECDSLDLSNPGSELNRLKMRYVREDIGPEQQAVDTPPMMREAEAQLIQSLVRTCGDTREAKAAIRLLCDFKDAVVSRMRTIMMWNYKMIFMVEANRPLSQLDARCRSLLDSLKQQSAQAADGKACEEVIDLVKPNILMPDPDVFSQICTTKLAESMRHALAAMTRRDEFRRIIDTLTQQFVRNEEERDRVLTYFMTTVDLTQQMADVIHTYRGHLTEQKVFVDNLLAALLQNLREQGMRNRDQMEGMRAHNDRMAAMTFYIDALVTEANWTADYDISLQVFADQCSGMEGPQSERRLQLQLKPRLRQEESERPELLLHYRLIRMQQDDARRLASDVAHVSSRLAGPVRLSWLCLADTYRGFMDDETVGLMIGFDGDYVSLAELPPVSLTDASRVAWLAGLLDCCAKLSATRSYRPSDYRPSCVLLRRLRPDEASDESGGGHRGLSNDAFPDPTRMLPDSDEALSQETVSLAACAVVLFTHWSSPDNSVADKDAHGWDARYAEERRQAVSGGADRARYLAGLQQRLGSATRSRNFVVAVYRCVRVCLESAAADFDGGSSRKTAEKLKEARQALLAASALTDRANNAAAI